MSIILNGTTGITTPAETATTSVTTPIVTSPASTALTIQSAGTTAMTIDTSQNVGIGTSSPTTKLTIQSSGANGLSLYQNGADAARLFFVNNTPSQGCAINNAGGSLAFYVGGSIPDSSTGTERMRIDSSGNLLVGRTSLVLPSGLSSTNVQSSLGYSAYNGTNAAQYTVDRISFNSSNFYVLNASSTGVVLVSGNTSWAAQSDERLKDIIEPIADAVDKVSTLRAVIGRYKTDDDSKRRAFLMAQDVQAVLPEAVSEDADGHLLLGYSETIPLLVAAIQELSAKNDALEAANAAFETRLAALEAK